MAGLVTGEAVELRIRRARLPTRALAAVIDLAVQAAVSGFVFGLAVAAVPDLDGALIAALLVISVVAGMIGYRMVFEGLTRGRTLGKIALGLRVVRDDGSAIRFRHALVRALTFPLLDFAPYFATLPGIVASLIDADGKRLGDMIAGTVVVRERQSRTAGPSLAVPGRLVHWAYSLELTALDDGLALVARDLLARWDGLDVDAREQLATEVARRISTVVAPPPPSFMTPHAYLSAVLAERRRRSEWRLVLTGER